jgi:hypothetical protein
MKNPVSDRAFLWRAIHGRHPAGRRYATLKIVPDDFYNQP